MPYATYRFNKIIAAETIRFIVTVAIVVYKGLKLVVYRMLTRKKHNKKEPRRIKTPGSSIHNEDCLLQKLNGSVSSNQSKPDSS